LFYYGRGAFLDEKHIGCQALKVDSSFSMSLDNFLSETISSFNLADALLTALP
jgi:hypothetical protein